MEHLQSSISSLKSKDLLYKSIKKTPLKLDLEFFIVNSFNEYFRIIVKSVDRYFYVYNIFVKLMTIDRYIEVFHYILYDIIPLLYDGILM